MEIEAERARLTQELESLLTEGKTVQSQSATQTVLEAQIKTAQNAFEQAEAALKKRTELDAELQSARQTASGS